MKEATDGRERTHRSDAAARRLGFSAVTGLALVLLALPVTAANATITAWAPASIPASWSNAYVTCSFAPKTPSVTITEVTNASAGLTLGVGEIRQSSTLGLLQASASLSNATWTAVNQSNASEYRVVYSAQVSVYTSVAGILTLVGTAEVNVSFTLDNYSSTSAVPDVRANRVAVDLKISHWPWQPLPGDLEADLTVAPAVVAAGHLVLNGSGVGTVTSVAAATGDAMAYVAVGSSVNATSSTGVPLLSPIVSAVTLVGATANLSLNFTSSVNNARSLDYGMAAVVETPLPSVLGPIARIPPSELAAAAGGGIALSLALAGVTRRLRRTPSDLEYVEGDS